MKKSFFVHALFILAFTLVLSSPSHAGKKEIRKVEDSIEVIKDIVSIPEKGMPPALLANAYGITVIPGVLKAGFVLGGRYGRGIMVVRTPEGEWSNPSFVSITGGSIGWQIGAQSTDIILVFKSQKGVEGIKKGGKFTLGADASIAAGPVGRHLGAATDVQLKAEIYSYSRSRGLFAGIAIEGAALQIDHDSNSSFYGREYVRVEDIFTGEVKKAPGVAKRFREVLVRAEAEAKGE